MAEVGITNYIQLYKTDYRPSITTNSSDKQSYLIDKFLITDENGKKIAQFQQKFSSTYFVKYYVTYVDTDSKEIASDSKARGTYLTEHFTADQLRENYEPNQFDVKTYENGVMKYRNEKIYRYGADGKVSLEKTNLDHANYYRNPTQINNKIYHAYVYGYYPNNDEDTSPCTKISYSLCNAINGGKNYEVRSQKYNSLKNAIRIYAYGTSASTTSSSERQNALEIYFNDTSKFMSINASLKDSKINSKDDKNFANATISATGETAQKIRITLTALDSSTTNLLDQKVTVKKNGAEEKKDNNTNYTLGEAISKYLSDYIQFSDETTEITVSNDTTCTVPKKIYARANFNSGHSAAGHDFLNVELVPVAVDGSFKYVAVYDSTTDSDGKTTYSDAFDAAVENETATTESSYVPSFCTLYKENYASFAAGTYEDKTENPFTTTESTSAE